MMERATNLLMKVKPTTCFDRGKSVMSAICPKCGCLVYSTEEKCECCETYIDWKSARSGKHGNNVFRGAYDELKNLYRVEDVEEINLGGGSFNYCHLVPVSTQFMEMMTKLINLRKPRYLSKNTDGQYVCSRCHSVISKYYDGIYCSHCGQRIKFGREDYDNND